MKLLGSHIKAHHLTASSPSMDDLAYEQWYCFVLAILTTLLKSMKPNSASIVMFQTSTKVI